MASSLTQKAIKASLMKLLNERPLDKITVRDIVEDCGVNRNTFYYHYQDIYALLDEVFADETKRMLDDADPRNQWIDGVARATQFALANKRAIYHIYRSVSHERLEAQLLRVAHELIIRYMRQQAEGLTVSEEDFQYITIFYKHAVVGLILEWLQNGMQTAPEYVIDKLRMLFRGSSRRLLETASEHNLRA